MLTWIYIILVLTACFEINAIMTQWMHSIVLGKLKEDQMMIYTYDEY